MTTLSPKLVVDKKKNKVVFAEADEDFVDVLCSFLTLPLGTVIRVLGKQSMLGCVDKLYRSVEDLDTKYLQTEACKKMLLEPRSESEILCEDLKLNVDDLFPRRIYRCPSFECFTKTHRLYSSISGARCPCGNDMDKPFELVRKEVDRKEGVFIKGGKRFIITDNLHVTPLHCMESTLSLFQKNGINNLDDVETKTVDFTRNEILLLLGRLLVSATPLTDVLLLNVGQDEDCNGIATCLPIHVTPVKLEEDSTAPTASKFIWVKLLYNKVSKKVLSTQSGQDFVDILFSFLTFPLGCIIKLLDINSSLKCLDNLYKSIDSLSKDPGYIKSQDCMNLLLDPILYPKFGCSNQLLRVEENSSVAVWVDGCENCWNGGIKLLTDSACKHNVDEVSTTELNPKLPNSGTECGGGYAMESVRFMVTDELEVMPLSSIYGIDAIKESNAAIDSLVEIGVTLGEVEVLHLLKACLNSCTALSNAFSWTILRNASSTRKRRMIVLD